LLRAVTAGFLAAAPGQARPAAGRQLERILRMENARIILTETVFNPGVPVRGRRRTTDQLIIFVDNCRYERTDPVSGSKSIRVRKAGDFIWYDKGGASPVLVNLGEAPYRTLLIELK